MDKHYDRDQAFGEEDDEEEEEHSDFLWCLHCERAYNRGAYRKVDGLQMCPYDGCDGDTVIDAWDWERVRTGRGRDYPAVPEEGKVYPLNP